jgi:IS4 transposase
MADRGYPKAKELRSGRAPSASGPRDFIVRVGSEALALLNQTSRPFTLIAQLNKPCSVGRVREWSVPAVVGSARRHTLPPVRLIAMPLPPDKAEAARLKLKRDASRWLETLDPRSLVSAGFIVLVTSLPAEIPADEIWAAYRLRWQIELAFERLPVSPPRGPLR